MVAVAAVIAALPVGDVIEAVNQVRDRRLACAGSTDECQLLAGLGVERDIVQNRLAGNVFKVHIKEPHVTLKRDKTDRTVLGDSFPCPSAGTLGTFAKRAVFFAAVDQRYSAVIGLRLLVKQIKDPACTCRSHGDCVHLLGHLRDVGSKLLAHAKIRRDNGDGKRRDKRSVHHEILDGDIRNRASERHEKAARERGEHVQKITDVVHDRHEDVCKTVCLLRVGEQLRVQCVKILFACGLVAEHFYDLLTVHHFLNVALNLAERFLLLDKENGRFAANVLGGGTHGDDAENDDQHQRNAIVDHHADNTHNRQSG